MSEVFRMNTVSILDIPVAQTTKAQFVPHVMEEMQQSNKAITIVTANPEIIMLAKENHSYECLLKASSYVVADGIGVVIGAKMLGTPLEERIPGYELVHEFMKAATPEQNRFFFYGSKPGVAEQAAEQAKSLYPQIEIVGVCDGYGNDGDGEEVARKAQKANPDFIFVATGAPKQEEWIAIHKEKFPRTVMMGVGGSFDVLSGNVDRAPQLFIKLNLEWFHRLITQPTRAKRMLKIPQFLLAVRRNKKK